LAKKKKKKKECILANKRREANSLGNLGKIFMRERAGNHLLQYFFEALVLVLLLLRSLPFKFFFCHWHPLLLQILSGFSSLGPGPGTGCDKSLNSQSGCGGDRIFPPESESKLNWLLLILLLLVLLRLVLNNLVKNLVKT
jgi:hypothetical protein